jgi:hypothetical protein
LVWGLVIAAAGLLAWAFVPGISRRLANVPLYRRPIPATGPAMDNGNGNGQVSAHKVAPARFFGGPRQVSLQLKASEPNLRRSVRPVTKPVTQQRPFGTVPVVAAAPMIEAPLHFAPEPVNFAPEPVLEAAAPTPGVGFDAVGPVVEQGISAEFAASEITQSEPVGFQPATDNFAPSPVDWAAPAPMEWNVPAPADETVTVSEPEPVAEALPVWEEETVFEEAPVSETLPVEEAGFSQPESIVEATVTHEEIHEPVVDAEVAPEPEAAAVETELEPIGQGEPVPYDMPVFEQETPESTAEPAPMEILPLFPTAFAATDSGMDGIESLREPTEAPFFSPPVVSTEPSVLQSTIPENMPEQTQTQNAPVIRTPAGGTPQPASAMHTAVQLTFSFEIASMQLTPSFKMGALQLRPTSKIVTMRLAPSQQPQPAMNLQVNFEITKIQPAGGGLGTVRLTPSQQTRPNVAGSPSFTVAGLQLVSNFESAPVQLTPSQQASVQVTGAFQIATVEFSPSFEIASIVLNSSAKQVAVQLPGAGSLEGAARFDIANLQLGPTGDIGMMQLNLAGAGR